MIPPPGRPIRIAFNDSFDQTPPVDATERGIIRYGRPGQGATEPNRIDAILILPLMGRMGAMTQARLRTIGAGHLALAGAVLIFGGCIGIATWRSERASGDAPVSAGPANATADPLAALAQRASANLADASAWRELGAASFEANRYDEAAHAYEKAAAIEPGSAAIWSALGEARVMASQHDPMPAPAAEAFRKALALDPKDSRARYFVAVGRDLAGDHAGAVAQWLALLADTPPGAPWEADLRRTIEQVGKINHIAVAERMAAIRQPAPAAPGAPVEGNDPHAGLLTSEGNRPLALSGIPGPSADQLRAASAIPPSQQQQMAEGMVARLEARLREQPANPQGWVMLMRSRMTLNQPDKARAALADAVRANPAQAEDLHRQAALLGLR